MSSKAEQHGAFQVSILIDLPDTEPQVITFAAPVRERDANDDLIPLSKVESMQQSMHAAICRLWSEWDSDYCKGCCLECGC